MAKEGVERVFMSGEVVLFPVAFIPEIVQQARRTAQGAVPQAIRAGVFQATGENGVKARRNFFQKIAGLVEGKFVEKTKGKGLPL